MAAPVARDVRTQPCRTGLRNSFNKLYYHDLGAELRTSSCQDPIRGRKTQWVLRPSHYAVTA
jgi:hypothetical protein